MAEVILETNIPREKGYIYYTSTNDKGNLTVCKAKAGRKAKGDKINVTSNIYTF